MGHRDCVVTAKDDVKRSGEERGVAASKPHADGGESVVLPRGSRTFAPPGPTHFLLREHRPARCFPPWCPFSSALRVPRSCSRWEAEAQGPRGQAAAEPPPSRHSGTVATGALELISWFILSVRFTAALGIGGLVSFTYSLKIF